MDGERQKGGGGCHKTEVTLAADIVRALKHLFVKNDLDGVVWYHIIVVKWIKQRRKRNKILRPPHHASKTLASHVTTVVEKNQHLRYDRKQYDKKIDHNTAAATHIHTRRWAYTAGMYVNPSSRHFGIEIRCKKKKTFCTI